MSVTVSNPVRPPPATTTVLRAAFAGLWAALAAQRAIHLASQEQNIEVLMVSPSPNVGIRPRLYE
ncbi:hypothetical protein IAF48_20565, partial [Acinetobacter baumannii]|nr:hypothetical protein [Acinetobacter baumannii]